MIYEINMNKYQEVKRKKNDISFKTSTIDDEEEESENEEFDLISKKLMKYIKFDNVKERRLHSKKESASAKKKKAMMVT